VTRPRTFTTLRLARPFLLAMAGAVYFPLASALATHLHVPDSHRRCVPRMNACGSRGPLPEQGNQDRRADECR